MQDKIKDLDSRLLDRALKKDAVLFTYLSDPMARQHYFKLMREGKINKEDTTDKKIKEIHDEIMKNLDKINNITKRETIPIVSGSKKKNKDDETPFRKKLKAFNKYAGELYKIPQLRKPIL